MRTFARAKVTGLVTVAAVVGTAGMAMAGTLPLPSQDALSRVLSKVGITGPATDHPATSGAVISSSRLTPPPLGATLVYPLVHLEIGGGMDANLEMGGEMEIEMDIEQQQGMASTVAEAAHAATVEIADTIHDAIDANRDSGTPDPAVGELLEKASVQADQSVSRASWIRGWFRRLRRSGASSSLPEADPPRSRRRPSTPFNPLTWLNW